MGSSSRCLFGESEISLKSSSSEVEAKVAKSGGVDDGERWCGPVKDEEKARRRVWILSEKKEANESGRDAVGIDEGRGLV